MVDSSIKRYMGYHFNRMLAIEFSNLIQGIIVIIHHLQKYNTILESETVGKRVFLLMEFLAKVATMPKMYLTCYKLLYQQVMVSTIPALVCSMPAMDFLKYFMACTVPNLYSSFLSPKTLIFLPFSQHKIFIPEGQSIKHIQTYLLLIFGSKQEHYCPMLTNRK